MNAYGTETIYRYVGHIRTNSFNKAIGMFEDPKRITRLRTFRSVKRDTVKKTHYRRFAFREIETIEKFVIDWNRREHGYISSECPIAEINQVIADQGFKDIVLEEIEYEFVDPKLVAFINDEMERRAIAKAIDDGKEFERARLVFFADDTKLYATFRNTTIRDAQAATYVKRLNRELVMKLKFKFGVLDLVGLGTERAKKYGEKENISVNDFPQIPKRVFLNLNSDGWPFDDRCVQYDGVKIHPKPTVLRKYMMSQKDGWILQGEIELEELH